MSILGTKQICLFDGVAHVSSAVIGAPPILAPVFCTAPGGGAFCGTLTAGPLQASQLAIPFRQTWAWAGKPDRRPVIPVVNYPPETHRESSPLGARVASNVSVWLNSLKA
jgi:hypothetical protein